MGSGDRRVHQRKCVRCRDSFETTSGKRVKCFECSPAVGTGSQVIRLPGFTPKPAEPESVPRTSADSEPDEPKGELEVRIRKTLEDMGLSDNWKAELVLGLARDLDRPGVTGAPRTSMTKQLFSLMDEFEGRRPPEADDIDELEAEADRLRGLSS